MVSIFFYLAVFFWSTIVESASKEITYLSFDNPNLHRELVYQDEPQIYCVDPLVTLNVLGIKTSNKSANGDNMSGVYDSLQEVVITVKTTSPTDTFSWHSIRGVSTDDLHSLLEAVVWKIFSHESAQEFDVSAKQSFLRDLFSSCPSPIFSMSRSVCDMPFSTFGTACVTMVSDKDVSVDVHLSKRFNHRVRNYLPSGILLVYFSGYLAKSKIFQYSSAMAISAVAGLILLGTYLLRSLLLPSLMPKGHSSLGPIVLSSILGLVFLGSFGATLVWYIKNTLRLSVLALENWEISAAYLAVASIAGLWVTRTLRADESSKRSLILCVKWVLRLLGTVLVYSSFASPLMSAAAVGILSVLYLLYAFDKFVLVKFLKRSKNAKNSKKKL